MRNKCFFFIKAEIRQAAAAEGLKIWGFTYSMQGILKDQVLLIYSAKWTSCIPSSTVPEQTTVYNGLKSFLKQYSHFYVKYRGPILYVTSPVLGSDDLSLDQSGTSIQILIEPNAVTWHVFYKLFFRPSFRLLCLLKSLECIFKKNLDPLCIIASLRTSYLVQVFESMY